ncbi:MAG TPA: SLC13 family permease [Dehalococcoidales bacterium]|nr:SLC13 family permease [Dehalococcoidales bacterium]
MEPIQLIALIIFLVTIGLIIWGKVDRAGIGIIGVVLMVLLGVMRETEAFMFVDWNVIAILFGIWIIAIYFGKTGIPQYLAITMLRVSRNNIALFLILLGVISAFISMFVDNVVVILMMVPVVLHVTQKMKLACFPFIIFIGLSANFMGTALLLGDLPPQMLHSVAGIEFPEFIWQAGRPSSFIILTVTYLLTAFLFYRFKFRKMYAGRAINNTAIEEMAVANPMEHIKNKKFAVVVVAVFCATILGMAFRELTGLHLGFIAITGALALVLIMETFKKKLGNHSFEEVIGELDWRALLFYVALFILVGGINHVGLIKLIANVMVSYVQSNFIGGATLIYWVTAPIVGIIEHDAYILTFLYIIRDLAASANINPWPLWWLVLWAGTLGSNLTVAGAPALFVAMNCCEKEDCAKVSLKQFFSYTIPFVAITLVICFVLALFIWIIPFAP